MVQSRVFLGLGLAVSLWSAAIGAQAQTETPSQAITAWRGTNLFDGTGQPLRPRTTIVVQGERIMAIQADDVPLPSGTQLIDASGLYVMPGLIDAHTHIATPPNAKTALQEMRRWIYSGVTAIRGMADDLRSVAELARQARVGEVPSPDIYYAALMAGPGFFNDPRTHAVSAGTTPGHSPWMQAIDETTDLPLAIAMARGTAASGVKIYADLPPQTVAAIAAEAHRQSLPVWTHAMVYPSTPQEVIAAGPDVMSHACILAHQAQAPDQRPSSYASRTPIDGAPFLNADHPVITDLARQMIHRGIILDATLRVYVEQERRHAAGLSRQPICSGAMTAALTRQAWLAGVSIAAGTDGETDPTDPWPALIEELELLQNQVGMPSHQVLVSATAINAKALNQGADMGTLEAGKLANFIILADDPTTDVAHLRSLISTVKRGKIFARSDAP